jgi:hypothetical protein
MELLLEQTENPDHGISYSRYHSRIDCPRVCSGAVRHFAGAIQGGYGNEIGRIREPPIQVRENF